MGWHEFDMIQLWNRFVSLAEQQLSRKMLNWDILRERPRISEVKSLFLISQNRLQFNIYAAQHKLFITV